MTINKRRMELATKNRTKNKRNRSYKPALGKTDYSIPKLGYKSSLFIFIASMATVYVVPQLMKLLFYDFRLPTSILSGIAIGFSVAFAQYYIERKKKPDRGFYILGGLLSVFISGAFFIIYYAGVIF